MTELFKPQDCGPASLYMIAMHYGIHISVRRTREICETSNNGTSVMGLIAGLEKIGLRAIGIRCTMHELVHLIPLPAIVLWNGNHYIVVNDVSAQFVSVSDPGKGNIKYSPLNFSRGWYAANKDNGIVIAIEKSTDAQYTYGNE